VIPVVLCHIASPTFCLLFPDVLKAYSSNTHSPLNALWVAAINDYYERHLAKKNDPYLESREKEDAFADRLVQTVEQKLLSNLPALAAMYQTQQQAFFSGGTAGWWDNALSVSAGKSGS